MARHAFGQTFAYHALIRLAPIRASGENRLGFAAPGPATASRPGARLPFRGKRGDYFKGLYWDGSGMWLIAKRLEKGRFVWPPIVDGTMTLTPALLSAVAEAERDRHPRGGVAEVKRDQRQRGRISVVPSHGAVASARPASWCPSPSSRRRCGGCASYGIRASRYRQSPTAWPPDAGVSISPPDRRRSVGSCETIAAAGD